MREFRPMPTTPKAMRHFEHAAKKGDRKDSQSVSFSQFVSLVSNRLTFAQNGKSSPYPRHSRATKRRAPDTRNTMRHFEKKRAVFGANTILKLSHPAIIRKFRPMPTTPRTMRHFEQAVKKEDRKDSQTVSFSQFVSLVSNRLTSTDKRNCHPTIVGERCGECDSPKIPFLPSHRFFPLCVLCALCGESSPPVVGEGWGEGDTPIQLAIIPHALRNTFYFL